MVSVNRPYIPTEVYRVIPTKWRSYRDHRLCDVTSSYVFTDEFVADADAVVDAVMADDEAVDESEDRCQVARHARVIAQLVHQKTEPIPLALGDLTPQTYKTSGKNNKKRQKRFEKSRKICLQHHETLIICQRENNVTPILADSNVLYCCLRMLK